MAHVTSNFSLPLDFGGIIKMRLNLKRAMQLLDVALNDINNELEGGVAPLLVSSALTTIVLTAAANFTNANGDIVPIATLYTTSATAVAASMTKTESDKVPIGTVLFITQSAGAVTITGSGGVTFTNRGTPTGGYTARAIKVSAALWFVDYGTPHA
jgi:hypothetical protein